MQQNNKYKFIFNPHAGQKRNALKSGSSISLEDIKSLLKQYQIEADYAPTKRPGHAKELAKDSIKEGYRNVIVAGGDGTVSEAANGLLGSDVSLGILPMGTFMNIARMLSIPQDMEKAVQLIKIGRKRKIDAGAITKLDGEKLSEPQYFFETVGVGLEAKIQSKFKEYEKGNKRALIHMIRTFTNFYANKITLITDNETIETKATLITIANGPFTGAALHLAPAAKLNDHKLSITLYQMEKKELLKYFFQMKFKGRTDQRRLRTFQTTSVTISSARPVLIHADATVFAHTPAVLKIVPNAIEVICGFPKSTEDTALNSRTILDP